MSLACTICIRKNGLRGSDIHKLPQTDEELYDHIEREHHMPVSREGESTEDAIRRFLAKYPKAATCSECIAAGAEWTKIADRAVPSSG